MMGTVVVKQRAQVGESIPGRTREAERMSVNSRFLKYYLPEAHTQWPEGFPLGLAFHPP